MTTWSKVGRGENGSVAVKTDGTLWTWGRNQNGQLGQNNLIDRSSPVQVGALTDWLNADRGNNHCVATRTNGTLWSWGANDEGALGDGTVVNVSSPIQIGAVTSWTNVSAALSSNRSFAIEENTVS